MAPAAITTVWARGDLTGSITAGRNVGAASDSDPPTESAYPVFSYGQISADISALNPAGVIGGGHIGPIGARGGIAGRFDAADSHRARRGTSHESASRRQSRPNDQVDNRRTIEENSQNAGGRFL